MSPTLRTWVWFNANYCLQGNVQHWFKSTCFIVDFLTMAVAFVQTFVTFCVDHSNNLLISFWSWPLSIAARASYYISHLIMSVPTSPIFTSSSSLIDDVSTALRSHLSVLLQASLLQWFPECKCPLCMLLLTKPTHQGASTTLQGHLFYNN